MLQVMHYSKLLRNGLKNVISGKDILARVGGDEFILLVRGLTSELQAPHLAKRIIETVRESFKIQQHLVKITTSIGITFFRDSILPGEELLKQADQALYAAKAGGRDTYRIFKPINEACL